MLAEMDGAALVGQRIEALGDWRGVTLAAVRQLILEADPQITEETKWAKPTNVAGVPVWSHGGIVCTGEDFEPIIKPRDPRTVPEFVRMYGTSLTQTAALATLRACMGPDDIIITAGGSLPSCMQRVWKTDKRGGYHVEYGYSCMGYEIGASMGVKMAEQAQLLKPDGGTVCLQLGNVAADNINARAAGFRDTTRLAASDLTMMLDILVTNRRAVASALEAYGEQLRSAAQLIASEDEAGLQRLLDGVSQRRKDLFE